jgi:hypothetical protein
MSDDDQPSSWDRMMECAPWFAGWHTKDGIRKVYYYGPDTTGAIDSLWKKYRQGRNPYNDSLFDEEIEIETCGTCHKCRIPTRPITRPDNNQILEWLEYNQDQLTDAETEITIDYWVSMLGAGQIATKRNVTKKRIENVIAIVRKLSRGNQ